MKLWIDDARPAPTEYFWCKSVNSAISTIIEYSDMIELIDIDHDAGDYVKDGGDYIRLLDWLEKTDRNYLIHIHTMNPVGRMNMEAICHKNGWEII